MSTTELQARIAELEGENVKWRGNWEVDAQLRMQAEKRTAELQELNESITKECAMHIENAAKCKEHAIDVGIENDALKRENAALKANPQ